MATAIDLFSLLSKYHATCYKIVLIISQIKKTENLNRQKLILIGECQCGKTSLMRSMVTGKSFMTREYDDSTAMVDFKAWKTENNVDLLVFDLGGDSVYKNTHQLFLDHQAMYLMVYDHRKYTVQSHHQAIGQLLHSSHLQLKLFKLITKL